MVFKYISLPTVDYEGDQAPRVSDYNGRVVDGEPLPVTLNLEIQSFDDIDTSKMSFRYCNTFCLSIELCFKKTNYFQYL